MKPTKTYKILKAESSSQLESQVNQYMKMNFKLIGGLSTHLSTSGSGEITYYFQSVYNDSYCENDLDSIIDMIKSGNKIGALKTYKELMNVSLQEAKNWVDIYATDKL